MHKAPARGFIHGDFALQYCNTNLKRVIAPIEFDFSRRILKVECGSSNPVFQMTSKRLVEGKHETVDSLHVMEFDLTQENCLSRENCQNSQQP